MKKLLISALACLAVVLIAVVLWLQFPRIHDPARLEAMRNSADARFQSLQAQASDPEKNGFLNPTLLPYWGRMGEEYQPDSPAELQIEAWGEYSSPTQGKLVDHKALQSDAKYLAARADLEKLAPGLLQSMTKPVFVAPDQTVDMNNVVLNYIAVRASAQAMIGLAEDRAAQGRPAEAADITVSVIQFGRTLQNQINLISDMMGIAVQAIGVEGYVGLLDPKAKLTAQQWKDLTVRLVEAIAPQDQMASVMESETNMVLLSADRFQEGVPILDLDDTSGLGIFKFPGFLGHEKRVYSNMAVEMDEVYHSPNPKTYPKHLGNPSYTDYLTGRVGLLGMVMMPNFFRAEAQMILIRAKVTGLALATAMIAYRTEKGRLPADFEELRGAGIAVPDQAIIEAVGVKYADGVITIPFQGQYVGDSNSEKSLYGARPWYQIKDELITIRP